GHRAYGDRQLPGDRFPAATAQLPCRDAVQGPDADQGVRDLPVAGRLILERYVPELVGDTLRGELPGVQRRDRAITRAQPGGVRDRSHVYGHDHGSGSADPTDDGVPPPAHTTRLAADEDRETGSKGPPASECRHLQCAEWQ